MSEMYYGCSSLANIPGIEKWEVSKVTNMSGMFKSAIKFNQPIRGLNVAKVTNLSFMFSETSNFNQPLNSWDVSHLNNMLYMFLNAYHFDQPVNVWDVSQVTSMTSAFYNAYAFNQSLSNWNLLSVTDMSYMLSFSGMDCPNMALTLQGWAANTETPDNIVLGPDVITYGLQAADALASLRDTKNWTFDIGAGIVC